MSKTTKIEKTENNIREIEKILACLRDENPWPSDPVLCYDPSTGELCFTSRLTCDPEAVVSRVDCCLFGVDGIEADLDSAFECMNKSWEWPDNLGDPASD